MTTVLDRIMRRVTVDDNGCWNWQGSKNPKGYGNIGIHGKVQLTHRVSYTVHVGDIPDGLQLDHLCRNTSCCNPEHLEPVTPTEHARRSIEATKDHCKHGHPLSGDNLIVRIRANGQRHRVCRECKRLARRSAPHPVGAPIGYQPRRQVTPEMAEQIRCTYAAGGISQRAVAREFGVSVTLVNFIVTGKRHAA